MKFIFCFLILHFSSVILFQSCKNSKQIPKENSSSANSSKENVLPQNVPGEIQKIIIDKTFTGDSLGAKFTIDTVFANGDVLEIQLKYSGGCNPHEFKLYTNKAYMKSLPPQLKLFLVHNNNNDHCRNLISKTLYYNISEIKYPGQKKLLLLVNDYPNKASYNY